MDVRKKRLSDRTVIQDPLNMNPRSGWRAGQISVISNLKAIEIFLARIRYPLHDEPIVKHDEPKFCNGQYWPWTMVGASSMTN